MLAVVQRLEPRDSGPIWGVRVLLISEMQKTLRHLELEKARRLRVLATATHARELADEREIRAAHAAREVGLTWREIAEASEKGSAASAASYFADSMSDRAAKREAARQRAAIRARGQKPPAGSVD
jgi:hypothetical protein